jgi:tetratricopeptide (TPR) repeat protein
MIGWRLGLAALAALGLAACATPAAVERAELRPALPERAEVAGVPFEPQEELWCGPAALAMALSWSGPKVTQAELAPEVYTSGRAGSLQADLVAAARRHDRLAVPVTELGDLMAELAAGHPVLVLQNLGLGWWPVWHYALAVGYDRAAGELVLRSGAEPRQRLSLATFERTWARAGHFGLVILAPDRLPASAGQAAVVQAAAGLERAGRLAAAATAYDTILERWPEDAGALLGRGNVRYAQGDLAGAERAFRAAVSGAAEDGAAWNNLAQVLWERGRTDAALEAAKRAVELGGPLAATYRTTLREIQDSGSAPGHSHPASAAATPAAPASDVVATMNVSKTALKGL